MDLNQNINALLLFLGQVQLVVSVPPRGCGQGGSLRSLQRRRRQHGPRHRWRRRPYRVRQDEGALLEVEADEKFLLVKPA